ncbi:MAG: flavin-containing monooxygenase [Mycobacterium sp.]
MGRRTADLPRTCIIGAGSSGIPAVKALKDEGIPFDCFERSDRVGGNWVFGNSNGMSSAYKTLCINTPRQLMHYNDLPMPKDIPDYPHHTHIADYFDSYADHFGLRQHIRFQTTVESVVPRAGGGYTVSLDTGESLDYDAVMVANGHHWDPSWPSFPGEFDGEVMHSHSYIDSEVARGKRVLVLGIGNSAMDISVEISSVAAKTVLATRRGAHIVPKYFLGKPASKPYASLLSSRLTRNLVAGANVLINGSPEKYGLPKPPPLSHTHPTVSSRFLDRLQHGAITVRPNIDHFEGHDVVFTDGSREPFDLIIYATGYKVSFPFFDPEFVSAPANKLPLYKHVFHPEHRNLMFIGLCQTLWALMPVAEWQSKWVASYLTGEYVLPSRDEMRKSIAADERERVKRYADTPRHTMQVDGFTYISAVRIEWMRGRMRARRAA